MTIASEFHDLELEALPAFSKETKAKGWRFVQMLCVNNEDSLDLIYSFVQNGTLSNYRIRNVARGTAIPSVTGEFLSAFVFENEAHDLFGANITNMAIDFAGNFYALSQKEPMTIVSPQQLAEREKKAKVAAALAAKAAKDAKAASGGDSVAKEGE